MKNFLIIGGVILLAIIGFNLCSGGADDDDEDEIITESNIDTIRERVSDVDGNVIILESGLRVRVIGTKPDNEWVATYLRAHVLGKMVRLVADRQIKTHMEDFDTEIPAYVILSDDKPSVNHLIVNDNPRAFDGTTLGDSLDDIRPRKIVHDEISDLAMYMKMRSFLIQTNNGLGTGFFINDDGLALTNNHVLSNNAAHIWLYDDKAHDNNEVAPERIRRIESILYTDPNLDITVFKVKLNAGETVDYFDLAAMHVPQGTRVATYGNPGGLTASYTTGDLSAYRTNGTRPLVQYSMATNPGNSGGPVADPTGQIVAVHDLGDKSQQNVNYGIDILAVREILDRKQLKYGGL